MSLSLVRIVCFDLGGVLVRICRSWPEACAAAGLDVRGDAASTRVDALRFAITDRYSAGLLSDQEWAEQIARAMNDAYTPEEVRRIHDAWTLDEYTEVGAVIDEIHRAGLPTACLSNTNNAHWGIVLHLDDGGARRADTPPRYPAVVRLGSHYASHLLGLIKPNPAIYRAFERATGMSGEQILFFDDLPENTEAARQCGWIAETIDPYVETAPQLRSLLARYRVLSR